MGMEVGTGGGAKADINITPLVDVVLVLLIIFMVLTPIIQLGYDLNIPRTIKDPIVNPPNPRKDQVILTLVPDESARPLPVRVLINKEEVPQVELATRLEGIYQGRPDKIMFLSAVRTVNYGAAMQIVDIARRAGGDQLKIGLVTDDAVAEKTASDAGSAAGVEGATGTPAPPPAAAPTGS